MSYAAARSGIMARLATVSGIKVLLKSEPTSVQDAPLVSVILVRFERNPGIGQKTAMRYFFDATLFLRWQDNAAAEDELDGFINAIPAAFDGASAAGLGQNNMIARCTDGDLGFAPSVGETTYRTVRFTIDVLEKGTYGGSI